MDFIKFLGTAGARFVVARQLRSSGGIWLSLSGTHIHVDPGPGALVRALKSRPALDPQTLDAVFLSHKHLDHSGDVNAMIEAMTDGGFKPKGVLFAPSDALEGEPVVFRYLRSFLERVEVLRENTGYRLKNVTLSIPGRHVHHGVETYGFKLRGENGPVIGYLPDAKYEERLAGEYQGSDILIVNTVLRERRPDLEHLSLPDVEEIIKRVHPRKAILTHFGMTMLKHHPWEETAEISQRTGTEVIAASDGMMLEIQADD